MDQAVAVFQQSNIQGDVLFSNTAKGVRVKVKFSRLPPGDHGFHIHRAGDLRGEGCKGACEHYHAGDSPANHGGPPGSRGQRHTGDLGNIAMPKSGIYENTFYLKGITVTDLYGRSVIVHADPDDLGKGGHEDSLTTGHSGARIGCAIIGRAKECM